ncbi:unnamed protein product [Adineta ricciae]|uniref:Pentapeptide repeat-containing protein n=1 Tax=Adineta ricciae TaxID=249248 RepID=A0A815LJ69_ADIRI|nr:unnamed protein product [Adineta ricciae]
MARYRRFDRNLHLRTQKLFTGKSNRLCFAWAKLALSASVPLMIGIFTIVSYVQQIKISENNREKEEGLANATREKDLSIATLNRLQDQMIANITRYHDLEIANLTQIKDWEIAMANLNIANETKIQDRQIAEDNRQEDRAQQQDLHYESLYSKYIDDISAILYKQQYNQSLFTSEETKMLYIRRKTLITLRSIDSERRSFLFIFLYENNLLPDRFSSNSTISLIGADLRNINISSPLTGSYEFNFLSLQSLNMINAVFVDCQFHGETNVSGSIMNNVRFIRAVFEDSLTFYKVKLINASFIDCVFKNKVNFDDSEMSSTQFLRSKFDRLSAMLINFTNGSFHSCQFADKTDFTRSVMNGITFTYSEFSTNVEHKFIQVSLNYADFHNMSLSHFIFQNSNLSYADFRDTYLYDVQFTSKTLLKKSNFQQANFNQVKFAHVNLVGSTIDSKQLEKSELTNIILPDGNWTINRESTRVL